MIMFTFICKNSTEKLKDIFIAPSSGTEEDEEQSCSLSGTILTSYGESQEGYLCPSLHQYCKQSVLKLQNKFRMPIFLLDMY